MRFSERKGLKLTRVDIQIESMDGALRTGLWNMLLLSCWNEIPVRRLSEDAHWQIFLHLIWMDLGRPIDTLPDHWPHALEELRQHFFSCQWYEVYDFLESVVQGAPLPLREAVDNLVPLCNHVLEQQLSAYRFIGHKIGDITVAEETAAIEGALADTERLTSVNIHLKQACDSLFDRKTPDYRGSMKESISAVEAMCRVLTKQPNATLGKALKQLEPALSVHPALLGAFDKIYGYTNDADGIRHALSGEPDLHSEDAKWMLVSCAAFISYLKAKAARASLPL